MTKKKRLASTNSPREGCPKVDANDQPVRYWREVSDRLPNRPIDGFGGRGQGIAGEIVSALLVALTCGRGTDGQVEVVHGGRGLKGVGPVLRLGSSDDSILSHGQCRHAQARVCDEKRRSGERRGRGVFCSVVLSDSLAKMKMRMTVSAQINLGRLAKSGPTSFALRSPLQNQRCACATGAGSSCRLCSRCLYSPVPVLENCSGPELLCLGWRAISADCLWPTLDFGDPGPIDDGERGTEYLPYQVSRQTDYLVKQSHNASWWHSTAWEKRG